MNKFKVINVKQRSPEWFEFRKDKIGASEASAIMNLSAFDTPYTLMEKRLGLADSVVNHSMQYGIENEERARVAFEKMSGLEVFEPVLQAVDRPWQIASLDGFTLDEDVSVEIKCPGEADHACAVSGNVPEHYLPQLQHQMSVTGLDMALYFSFRGDSGVIIEVRRDQCFIDQMLEEEEKFWNLLKKGELPPLSEKDYINMENNEEWIRLIKAYDLHKKKEEEAKEMADKIKKDLISFTNGRRAKGNGHKLTLVSQEGRVDYSKIPELKGVDLSAYRKAGTSFWRISS